MHLLHVVATPRAVASNTLRISHAFVDSLRDRYPHLTVETLDLFAGHLPSLDSDHVETKLALMAGRPIGAHAAESWRSVEALIAQFLAADVHLISSPMWNFGVPYVLKYYIDAIVQPGHLFSYAQGAPVGLCPGKKMVCVTTRGGDYSPGSPLHLFDQQEPYLRTIFGFIGITDIQFVNAQPMDVDPGLREIAIGDAVQAVRRLATDRDWAPVQRSEVRQSADGALLATSQEGVALPAMAAI
jgi:FMN-dependent NADH-azoreductase